MGLAALAVRVGRAIRTAWLICGVTIVLMLGLELLYRGQAAFRRTLSRGHDSAPIDASPREQWLLQYAVEWREANRGVHWTPYVYWRRAPFRGRYITIDSLGHRLTVQGGARGTRVKRIFFFGGSTMWGSYQSDSMTIPSLVAARLAARGITDVEITNLGETGYVFTQELLALLLELRRGARPDVVVFYDGINDVFAAVQNGSAGSPLNERNRAAEFDLGGTIATGGDLRAFTTLGLLAAERSHFLRRLRRLGATSDTIGMSTDSLASDVVVTYARTAEAAEALSRAYGFRVLYFWQPTVQTTPKPLTLLERSVRDNFAADHFGRRVQAVHRAVLGRIDSAMACYAPGAFVNLWRLFAGDTATVYLDHIGHTTEAASGTIAAAMLDPLLALFAEAPRRAVNRKLQALSVGADDCLLADAVALDDDQGTKR